MHKLKIIDRAQTRRLLCGGVGFILFASTLASSMEAAPIPQVAHTHRSGGQDKEDILMLRNKVDQLREKGDFSAATLIQEKILRSAEKELAPGDTTLAITINNLAYLYK